MGFGINKFSRIEKIKYFFTQTFLGRLSPLLVVAIGLGVFFPIQVVMWSSLALIGIWLLWSLIIYITYISGPPNDDGGCAGSLIVLFFNIAMIEVALWASFAISYLCKMYVFV